MSRWFDREFWIRNLKRLRPRRPEPGPMIPEGARYTYATHGEDIIAQELLMRAGFTRTSGYYVDVGAYHPWRFSNTADLYMKGWSGLLVEPNPYMAALIREHRPRDVVVEGAIAEKEGSGEYFSFGPWGSSNTMDPEWAASVTNTQGVEIEESIIVRTSTLEKLLDEHLPEQTPIDLLTVDVEGLDLVVLESNNWGRYRPLLVAVEEYEMDLANPRASQVFDFMTKQGYELVSRAVLTNFYQRS